jgi:hypothetical protein
MRILFHYSQELTRIMKLGDYTGNTKVKASPYEVKSAVHV